MCQLSQTSEKIMYTDFNLSRTGFHNTHMFSHNITWAWVNFNRIKSDGIHTYWSSLSYIWKTLFSDVGVAGVVSQSLFHLVFSPQLGLPRRIPTQYLKDQANDYTHPGSPGSRQAFLPSSQVWVLQAKDPKHAIYWIYWIVIWHIGYIGYIVHTENIPPIKWVN